MANSEDLSLSEAVENSNVEVVKTLLTKNDGSAIEQELFHSAIQTGCLEVIEFLLQNGANANGATFQDEIVNPIFLAIGTSNPKIVEMLLSYGANIQPYHNEYYFEAIKLGNLEIIKLLLLQDSYYSYPSNCKGSICYCNFRIVKPIIFAIKNLNPKIVSLFFAHSFLHEGEQYDGELLITAVAEGSPEIVEILLRAGVDPNKEIESRFTRRDPALDALLYELRHQYLRFSLKTATEIRPLHIAAYFDQHHTASLLIEYGAEVTFICIRPCGIKISSRRTPLHIAAEKGCLNVCKILLEFNATVEFDAYGNTAFQIAAQNGHHAVLRALLDYFFQSPKIVKRAQICSIPFELSPMMVPLQSSRNYCRDEMVEHTIFEYSLMLDLVHRLSLPETAVDFPFPLESKLQDLKDRSYEEIERLKIETIGDTNVTLYDFLKLNEEQLTGLVRNDEIVKTFKTGDIAKRFKSFGSILQSQFRKGETRRASLVEAIEVSHLLLNDLILAEHELIMEAIFSYLNNRDLKVFSKACTLSRSQAQRPQSD